MQPLEATEQTPRLCADLKQNGEPCPMNAKEDSDFCSVHLAKRQREASALERETLSVPVDALRNALEAAEAGTSLLGDVSLTDSVDDDFSDNDPPPARPAPKPAPERQAAAAADSEIPEGYELRWEYDPKLDDWVEKPVRIGTERIIVKDPSAFHDAFELGDAYASGDAARFDYRWMHVDERHNRVDRGHGFVPVKEALDTRFRKGIHGAVQNGDLVLARRPKEITMQRAVEMNELHERLLGNQVDDFHMEGQANGAPTFGGVAETESEALRGRVASSRPPERPRGRRSYAFPNNPLGRDKVAERHRSVGG